jgi:outer membrane protein insertion porin family
VVYRFRPFLFLLVLMIAGGAQSVSAADPIRVVVLPFEVNAPTPQEAFSTEIADALKQQLQEEGVAVVEFQGVWKSSGSVMEDLSQIRAIGVEAGADRVIWGSLTSFGQQYSLDARVVETFGEGTPNPKSFFVEGRNLGTLVARLKGLSHSIGMEVLDRKTIAAILVEGNDRIEADAIKRVIKTREGDVFKAQPLTRDLKKIYAMGYFDDVRVAARNVAGGKAVVFKVQEKPTIRNIAFKGNEKYKDKKLTENLTLRTGSILNIFKIQSNIAILEDLYKEKNYHHVQVTYKTLELKNNQADLEFTIVEGERSRIENIIFDGNSEYPDKTLKKLVETSEAWFFSFIDDAGDLDHEKLKQDVAILTSFYHDTGYINARVGEPEVVFTEVGIDVTFKIDEGERYKVGKVSLIGEFVLPENSLKAILQIFHGEFFSKSLMRQDILAITDIYADEGYAYSEVIPKVQRRDQELLVDVTYDIRKGPLVYYEKIIISGNTKTRDKVIRRELKVYERELYSGKRMKRGVRNLYYLDFFDDIQVDTPKGNADDQMLLKINVKEKNTGTFSVGGGYSSVESVYFNTSISQRNLFGRAQILKLEASIGGRTQRFDLSLTEPWLFDIPLSATSRIYNWKVDYESYSKESIGVGAGAGYPVYDFTRAYFNYRFDSSKVSDVETNAPDSVKELSGTNITSSLKGSLIYDSRDKRFNTTRGGKHSISAEYAGLGGTIGFTKIVAETGWYIPLFWKFTGFLHGKAGHVAEHEGELLPDYEKFFLGGMNSVRGYDWQDLAPIEINSAGQVAYVGGDKYVQFNSELRFPLVEQAGVIGLVFFDAGDVYAQDADVNPGKLRKSAGYGLRWYSPMGPIRLENAYILDPRPGGSEGSKWEFSMGAAF